MIASIVHILHSCVKTVVEGFVDFAKQGCIKLGVLLHVQSLVGVSVLQIENLLMYLFFLVARRCYFVACYSSVFVHFVLLLLAIYLVSYFSEVLLMRVNSKVRVIVVTVEDVVHVVPVRLLLPTTH